MNTSNPKFWALIGFVFGIVIAAGGNISTPLDALFGGLIQAAIWFGIASFIIQRKNKKISEANATEIKPSQRDGKTKFLFDSPVTSDWLFWVFSAILAINILGGVSNVANSGGLVFSTGGIISGLLDGLFRVILSWFPVIPIIYSIRKLIRKRKESK